MPFYKSDILSGVLRTGTMATGGGGGEAAALDYGQVTVTEKNGSVCSEVPGKVEPEDGQIKNDFADGDLNLRAAIHMDRGAGAESAAGLGLVLPPL